MSTHRRAAPSLSALIRRTQPVTWTLPAVRVDRRRELRRFPGQLPAEPGKNPVPLRERWNADLYAARVFFPFADGSVTCTARTGRPETWSTASFGLPLL